MTLLNQDSIIETTHLLLRPVSEEYKYDISKEFTPEVTRYMPFEPTGDIKVTEEFIKNSNKELEDGTGVHFCILSIDSKEFLGCCGLYHTDTTTIEIGIWLKKSIHSKGYGTESVMALIELAERQFDFDYLFYPVDKDNIPSRKIPEKLGFSPSKTLTRKVKNLNLVEYRRNRKTTPNE